MKWEIILLFCLLLIFPFGQLTKLSLNIPQINLYIHDIIVIFFLLSWLLNKIFKKEKIVWPFLTRPIIGFVICSFFSLLLALPYYQSREVVVALLYLLRWLAYAVIYLIIVNLSLKNKQLKDKINSFLIISIFTTAVLGFYQYFFIPDITPLTAFGWDPHYYRLVGTFLDPGYTGMIFVLGLILIAFKLWQTKTNQQTTLNRLGRSLAFLVIYLALALTYSRSAYLAYLGGMAVLAVRKRSVKFFITIVLVGALTVYLLPRPGGEGVKLERKSTAVARIGNWRQAVQIIKDKPLFGVGFNAYRYVQRDYQFLKQSNWQKTHAGAGADSSLLFVLATTGVVGFLSFLELMRRIYQGKYNNQAVVIKAVVISLLIHSCFNNSLFYAWIMLFIWILLGSNQQIKENN